MNDKERAIARWNSILKAQARYIIENDIESEENKKAQMEIIEHFKKELDKMKENKEIENIR